MKCPTCPMGDHPSPCLGQSQPKACGSARKGPNAAGMVRWQSLHAVGLATHGPQVFESPDSAKEIDRLISVFSAVPRDGRVRVGIVSPNCYLGGAERWICDLLDYCDGSKIQWAGVAIKADPSGPEVPNVRADWEEHCPVRSGDAAIGALGRASDVLISWGVVGFQWGISSARLRELVPANVPVIAVSHGSHEYPGINEETPATIPYAVSRIAIRGLPRSQRESARVILNGISESRVARTRTREEMRAEWGIPPGAKVVGWLARVEWDKRYRTWIDGVGGLPGDYVGVMAGTGMDLADARDHAAKVCPGRIIFLGPRYDVGDVLGGFDVLVSPSKMEACSLAAGEAWLAGVPFVSTPVGILEPGDHPELARLLPPDSTGADLADAILADEADVEGTRARVELAREFARVEMSMSRFGREWTEALTSFATRRQSRNSALSVERAVLRCPHRRKPDCGCPEQPHTCTRPDQSGKAVWWADCVACQCQERDDEAARAR